MMDKIPYTIEVDEDSQCPYCNQGATWQIIGPDDVGLGIAFGDKIEAQQWADELSRAYLAGAQDAIKALQPQ